MSRDDLPNVPATAVVWCVKLAKAPPDTERLVQLCRSRWGAHYTGMTPSRIRGIVRWCVGRGWLQVGGEGRHAKIRMADGNRFMLEHDPALLRGHERALQNAQADTAAAWRRANPGGRR